MNQNSLGQPLFLGHSGVRCEPSWLNVQSQQLSGFCPSGAVRADGKKEGEEPWEILCWCRRTRMDDRLPPGKEISQCQCWEGWGPDLAKEANSYQGAEQIPWPPGEGNSQGTGVWKLWLSPMDAFHLRKGGKKKGRNEIIGLIGLCWKSRKEKREEKVLRQLLSVSLNFRLWKEVWKSLRN